MQPTALVGLNVPQANVSSVTGQTPVVNTPAGNPAVVYNYDNGRPVTADNPQALYNSRTGQKIGYDSTKISSSGMALDNTNQGSATSNAGSVLTSGGQAPTPPQPPVGPQPSWMPQSTILTPEQQQAQVKALADAQFSPLDSIYNAQLANQNQVYANSMAALKEQTNTQHKAWDYTATSLNPYASSRTSSNLTQHHQTIDNRATALANDLTAKAEQAQLALSMGKAKEYIAIQQNMQKLVSDYQKDMQTELWKQSEFMQTERSMEERQFEFNVGQKNVAADNFKGLLSTSLPATAELQKMIQSGEIKNNPLYQEAIKAGYDPQGAIDLIQSGAKAQEDKTGMEWAKFNLQLDREERLSTTQNQTQIQAAIINYVSSIPRPDAKAPMEDWANYYRTIASKTAGGKTDFRIAQDFSNLNTVTEQMGNIKSAIEGLKNTDPLVNLIAKNIPWAEKTKELEATLNASAAPLARLFGEKGTLAEGDVNRIKNAIGNTTQPAAVREKMFNEIVKIVGEKYFNNIEGYASQGYNVSAYAKDVANIQQFMQETQVATGSEPQQKASGDKGYQWAKGWGGYNLGQEIRNKNDGKLYIVGKDGLTPK